MKPLLVIPPAPARWTALEELLREHLPSPWLSDLSRRVRSGIQNSDDAIAIMPAGGLDLAAAYIHKRRDVGLLGTVFTRPEHRKRGIARVLTEALLAWFDMTGGRWLFLSATRELEDGLFRKFGFELLRQADWEPHDRMTLVRRGPGVHGDPALDPSLPIQVRGAGRADWPETIAFLQYFSGPDPRVPLGESAVTAELLVLDLFEHQERGACELLGAWRGERLVGLATVATDRPGHRTYAMLMPNRDAPAELRAAVVEAARARDYEHVEFPMEALG